MNKIYINTLKNLTRFELGLGTFFTLMGLVFVIEGIKEHNYWLSLISFVIFCGYGLLCFFAVRENLKSIKKVKK